MAEIDLPKHRSLLLFIAISVATFFQQSAPAMLWDAEVYLRGSVALISGGNIYVDGGLDLRGAWSPIVYSPAAAVNHIIGRSGYGEGLFVFVLLQNAVLVGAISTLLLPALMRLWFPRNSTSLIVCATIGYFVLRNFAPYSLMDTWAIALVLLAVCLIERRGFASLFFAGLAIGVGVNLRPSYLLTAVVITVITVVSLRYRGLLMIVGLVVAQTPQIVVNWFVNGRMTPFPVSLAGVSGNRAVWTLFTIRYDTIAYRPFAEGAQLFCDPAMVRVALSELPPSRSDLVMVFVTNPLQSGWFFIEKLGAVLLWPVTVPYFEWIPVLNLLFGVVIVLITVLGISGLMLTRTKSPALSLPRVAALVVIGGVLVNLVLFHTETRYAIPLVLIGVAGIAGLAGHCASHGIRRRDIRGGLPTAIVVLAVAVLLSVSGHQGLQHANSCPSEESLKNAEVRP